MFPPVLSKNDFVKRFLTNEFGNRGPNWNTFEEFQKSGYTGLVHIRNRVAGGWGKYDVPYWKVRKELEAAIREHGDTFYLAGMAPTDRTILQGEVYQRAGATPKQCGWYLYYSTIREPMRAALAKGGKEAFGLEAVSLLKMSMNDADWEWLNILLDRYPGHVIEFSTYSIEWGTLPGHRTVFWEVRSY